MWKPILKILMLHNITTCQFIFHGILPVKNQSQPQASFTDLKAQLTEGLNNTLHALWLFILSSDIRKPFTINLNNVFSGTNWWGLRDPMQRERNKIALQKFLRLHCNINNKMFISSKALEKEVCFMLKKLWIECDLCGQAIPVHGASLDADLLLKG